MKRPRCGEVSGSVAGMLRDWDIAGTTTARCGWWALSLLMSCLIAVSTSGLARAECSPDDVHPVAGAAFLDFPPGTTVTITLEKLTHDYGLYVVGALPAEIAIETLTRRGIRRLTDPRSFEFWVDNSMNPSCQMQTCSLQATFDTVTATRLGLGQWSKDPAEMNMSAHGNLTAGGPDGPHRIGLNGIPSSEGHIHVGWDCTPSASPLRPGR